MENLCPRCQIANPAVARFCRACGLSLAYGVDGSRDAGRVEHPRPLSVSPEYQRCANAADLFYRVESALGGAALLDTEGVRVSLFNRGYALEAAELQIVGLGDGDNRLFEITRSCDELPQGGAFVIEAPSYEVPAPMRLLKVTLLAARYGRTGV